MSVQPAITLQQQQSQPPPPSQQQPDSNANLIGGNSNINSSSSSSSQTGGGLFLQPTLGQVQTQPQSYYIVQQQSSSSSAINQPSQMTVLKQPTVIFNQQQPQQQQQQQTVTNYQIVQPQSQTQPQQQMMSNGQTMIIQPNIKYVSNGQLIQQQPQQQSQQQPQSPRIIMQHPQQQTTYIMPQTQNSQQQQPQQQQQINGGGNQFYLNINNRIVPIQSLNIKPTSSVNIQPSIQQQQQPQQQQQTQQQQQYFIVSNNNAANSQSGVQLNQVVANTQNSSNQIQGMMQSPTIITNKPTTTTTTTTTTTSNPVTSTLITSSETTTTNSINSNSSNVGVEIAEKMKQLEQVQSQLRQFQTKIVSQLNLNNGEQQPQQLVLTQQQIQSVLSPAEQSTLARLIQQKKQFEAEVQTLKHKLLMSSSSSSASSTSSSSSLAVNSTTNLDTQSNSSQPMSKMQLLQQVTLKLNQLRASKTVTNGTTSDGSQPQQQLVLTAEEFEQMKRLVELQSRLHAEIQQQQQQQESTTNTTTTTTTTPQTQTIKLNELNLAEKLKLNELIKNQLEQIKQALAQLAANNKPEQSALVAQQQQQLKDKYVVLLKKQGELQALIQHQQQQQQQQAKIGGQNILFQTSSESPTYQILVNGNKAQQQLTPTTTPNKQTPVKIRNVISSSPLSTTTTTTTTTGQPLRTLVLNANTNIVTTPSSNGLLVPQQQLIYPLSYAQNLQKLPQFASVQFKRLSFVELAQHGVITKNTDELAVLIIKQLDERAASLIGPEASSEQADAFAKNQVRLVKKYLEQQLAVRHAVRTRIHEQLVKDQKLALEPDYKTPFVDKTDAIKRLSRFHVFQKTLYEPTEEDGKKFDECFEQVSDRLLKTANAMKKRFHLFQLRSMQKDVAPSEETMMLRLLVDDLKASQEEVKQQQQQSNAYPQKATTNESINNDFVILNSTNLGLKRPLNEHNNNNDTSSSVTSNTNGIDHESSMVKKIARLDPNAAAATPKSDANSTDKVEFDLGERDEDEENSNSLKNSKQLIASTAATTNNSDLFSLSDYNTETSESNAKISASTVTLPPSNSNHLDLVSQPPSTNNFINYDFNNVQAPNRTASNTNTMINPTTTTTTIEEDEDANVMNNLSGLDDLILNEDELAVNCDSMFD